LRLGLARIPTRLKTILYTDWRAEAVAAIDSGEIRSLLDGYFLYIGDPRRQGADLDRKGLGDVSWNETETSRRQINPENGRRSTTWLTSKVATHEDRLQQSTR
jgi:hypothetical protein